MNLRNILIVAATRMEVAPLLDELKAGDLPTGRVRSFMWKQMPLDILITGPGMVATAFYLGRVRGFHEYFLVLNVGIAGSFKKTLNIGDVVNVTTDCFPEMGAIKEKQFVPMYGMPMAQNDRPEYVSSENMIQNTAIPMITALSALPQSKGITVNTLSGKAWKKSPAFPDFEPDVETMEGAAFMFACRTAGVAFAEVRAISNPIGPEASWDIQTAANALHTTLLQIFNEL